MIKCHYMAKITKLIIPVAGYGTRFLPFTKAMPKEMIPIVDKPVIQQICEDAVESGITDIILITGSNKRAIEDHFDFNFELEAKLQEAGKLEQYEEIRRVARMARFVYVRQKEPKGNGHAVLQARQLVEKEPFAVVWGDEFHATNPPAAMPNSTSPTGDDTTDIGKYSDSGEQQLRAGPPHIKQLIDAYEKYEKPIITLIRSPKDQHADFCSKYGCVDAQEVGPGVYKIKRIIEKPKPEEAPGDLFSLGGYVLTPRIMEILGETEPGKGGEIWMVDAIDQAIKEGEVYGKLIDSTYHDIGGKIGFLKATVSAGLARPDTKEEFKKYLNDLDTK